MASISLPSAIGLHRHPAAIGIPLFQARVSGEYLPNRGKNVDNGIATTLRCLSRALWRRRRSFTVVLVGPIGLLGSLTCLSTPAESHSSSHVTLPSTKAGCHTASPAVGQATSVPIAVSHHAMATIALISTCINGKGPFPLIIDTGATTSEVDSQVVKALHLRSAGKSTKVSGASCSESVRPVKVSSWSVGTIALQGQTVTSSSVPNFGLHNAPAGLLGSDVLSRFGAVRLDYKNQKLILPGAEGPAQPVTQRIVKGPGSTPTPADLLAGYPTPTTIPIDVVEADHQVVALAPVQFASFPKGIFILDTGSSSSAVASLTASALKLTKVPKKLKVSGVACQVNAPEYKSGKWSLGGTPLRPQALVSLKLPGISIAGVEGLLGSNQLSFFGSIVIDYAGGRLLI
jgi:predicted aspartyl protease